MTRNAGGLYEPRVASTDSQQGKRRPHLYNPKELSSANNLNELGSGFFLSLQMRAQPGSTLISAFETLSRELCVAS